MRWLFRIAVTLILLAVVAVGGLFLLPSERIAGLAVTQFEKLTGRQLTLTGAAAPSFWPNFGIETGPVAISNASWSDEGPMLTAEALRISLDMGGLLSGDFRIRAVEAVRPVIRLERNTDGAANWEFGGGGSGANTGTITTATPGVGKPFTLDRLSLDGATLIYNDRQSGTRLELADLTGTISIPDYRGPVTADLTGRRAGQEFAATLTLGGFQQFLDGEDVAADLQLSAGKAWATFAGLAAQGPVRTSGKLDADLGDMKGFAALAGLAAPSLPPGLGQRSVKVRGDLAITDQGDLSLGNGEVTLDGTALSVSASLTPGGERPYIRASVAGGGFEAGGGASGAAAGGEAQGAEAGKARGWSTAPIDANGLKAFDGEITLDLGSLRLAGLKLDGLSARLTNERGRLVADLRRISAYGGVASGQMVVNARKGLSTSGDLTLAGIALQPFLTDLAGYGRLSGTGDMRVKYLASGRSLAELMASLEGGGSLSVGRGELIGADLAAMMITLDASQYGTGQKTIFDSLTATYTMAGGVLSNQDFLMVSPRVTAKGRGEVDIGGRTLDYRLSAVALADDQGQGGLTAPLIIYGSWDNPRFTIDLDALAKENFREDLDEVGKKLQDELGITPNPGESVEDAAKRKAEEALQNELEKALNNLFGGN
ncbi:AsmA family protein [Frigidibacter sp. RF13]|uniref:AsmA family protein n=1 Tax=Frigidibacter sp. RF13 TaxID=2997340 RepID=UPI00226F5638|nr:AsmA family protein [Frigidibacter sp. RF13]MCY1128727.1 AsmA family protein [Frigidibacter sp. RF13]